VSHLLKGRRVADVAKVVRANLLVERDEKVEIESHADILTDAAALVPR
jgi:hypothetical protein